MPAGFQVFNADGSLQFDTSNRLFRSFITIVTGTSNGSQNVPGLSAAGTPVVIVLGAGTATQTRPKVSVSGDTVSWTFSGGSPASSTLIVLVN